MSKINEEINDLKGKENTMEEESEPSVEEINVTGREKKTELTEDEINFFMQFFNW